MNAHATIETLTEFLGSCLLGLAIAGMVWLGLEQDDADLQNGKSPHSGATPDYPTPIINK